MSVLQDALASSIADGAFADTAYYLYTTRLRNAEVGKPRVVHGNSRVMRAAVPYLAARVSSVLQSTYT